jgi:antitoxin ParD1/3/4
MTKICHPKAVTQIDTQLTTVDNISMATRTSLNVSLTPELEKFVQDRVAGGRYQTASEVVREGLRLLELQERDRDEAFKALKEKLQRAAEQAQRGEVVDGEAYFEQLFARLGKKIPSAGAA